MGSETIVVGLPSRLDGTPTERDARGGRFHRRAEDADDGAGGRPKTSA